MAFSLFDPQTYIQGAKAAGSLLSRIKDSIKQPEPSGVLDRIKSEVKPVPQISASAGVSAKLPVERQFDFSKLPPGTKVSKDGRPIDAYGGAFQKNAAISKPKFTDFNPNPYNDPDLEKLSFNWVKDYNSTPLANYSKTVKNTIVSNVQAIKDKASAFKKDPSLWKGMGVGIEATHLAFAPISAFFEESQKIPVAGTAIKSVLGVISEGATNWTEYAFQPTKYDTPFFADMKQNFLKPLALDTIQLLAFDGLTKMAKIAKTSASTKPFDFTEEQLNHVKAEAKVNVLEQEANKPIGPKSSIEELSRQEEASAQLPLAREELANAKASNPNPLTTKQKTAIFDWHRKVESAMSASNPLTALERLGIIKEGESSVGSAKIEKTVRVPREPVKAAVDLWNKVFGSEPLPFIENLIESAHPKDLAIVTKTLQATWDHIRNRGGIRDAGIGLKAKEGPGTFGERGMEVSTGQDLIKKTEKPSESPTPLTNVVESGNIESANPPYNEASPSGQISAGGATPKERPGEVQASPEGPVGGEGGVGGADLGTDGNGLRDGGQLATNAKALEIIKKPIERITPAEKEILRNYEGLGGQEKAGAEGRGLLDQYYTPKPVVKRMWDLASQYGFKEGDKVLEPSMGTGRFIENGPKATYLGFDTDPNAVGIAKVLLDGKDAILQNKQFEELFVDKNGVRTKAKYNLDLVIGNPPYGKHRGYFQSLDEPKITSYEDYFIKRGLDVLKPGGTLIMLVPSSFLRTGVDSAKGLIAQQGRLADAYRLPEGTFKTTGIGTDILVFKKDPIGKDGADPLKLEERLKRLSKDNFFTENPKNIEGEVKTRRNRFGKEETYVAKRKDATLKNASEMVAEKKTLEVATTKKEGRVLPEKEDLKSSIGNLIKELDDGGSVKTFQNFADRSMEIALNSEDPDAGKIIKAAQDYKNAISEGENADLAEERMMAEIKSAIGRKAAKPEIHEPKMKTAGSFFKSAAQYTESELSMWRAKGPDGSVDVNKTSYPIEKLNIYKGKHYDDFDYLTGNLYEKIDQLKKEDIPEGKKAEQEAKLRKALPIPKTVEKINLNPIGQFAQDFKVGDVSLMEDFKNYMSNLPNEAFAPSGRYETIGYIRGDSVRTGKDKVLAMAIKQRRKATAEKLFRKFVTEDLAKDTQKRLVDEFNRSMNGYAKPDYTKVPLTVDGLDTDFGGRKLYMQDYKVDSIGFLSHKGLGINANGVGLGKTMMAIISTVQDVQKGWYKRPVFIVPKGVYAKWISEIKALFPGQKVVGLGNLGTKFNVRTANDLKGMIQDGDITVITHEAIMRFGFKDDTIAFLTSDLQNAYDVESAKTKRGEALDAEKRQATAGKARLRSDLHFEELGFDNIIVDEAHNFKNIFERAKSPEKVSKADLRAQGRHDEIGKPSFAGRWGGLQGPSSARGVKLWFISQYIQSLNKGRGVKLLTATPFSNNPLEYYNMLSLLAMDEMRDMGVGNINGFMDMFVRSKHTFVVKAGGKFELGEVVEDWQNADVLRGLIGRYIDFKDGEKYGVDRPSKTVKDHRLNPTAKQIDHLQQAQELLDQKHKQEGGVLVYIDEAKKITLSPYLSRYSRESIPDAKAFIESSPKLMAIMELIRANQKKTGQLIYYPLAVETMPMVKEYLTTKIGYKPSEVEIIHGQVTDQMREKIKADFNSGAVKVIIGSDAIKEGVDLQERATDLYISSYPWRPTDITQVEGRIWRQGNIYKGVRVHFVSLNDTIDPFLFQKLETKAKRLSSAGSLDQAMDLGDMDWEEAKHELVRDPAAKLNLKRQMATGKIEQELNAKKSEAAIINDTLGKEEVLTSAVDRAKRSMDMYSSGYMAEHYKKEFKNAERRLKSFKEKEIDEEELRATTDRLKSEIAQLEDDLSKTKTDFDKKAQEIKPLEQLEVKPNDFGSILENAKAENESFIQAKVPVEQQEVKVLKKRQISDKVEKELPTFEDGKPDPTIEKVVSEIQFPPHMIPLDAKYVTPTGEMMKGYVEMTIPEVEEYAKRNAGKLIKWYKENISKKNISADDFKLVFPGYDGVNSNTYHPGASILAKKMLAEYIADVKPGDSVIFTAGGSGAGKTHGSKAANMDYKFLVDGNFASEKPVAAVEEILAKGGQVVLNLTIRDIFDAWKNGVFPRFLKTGRIVGLPTHLRTHIGSLEQTLKLHEKHIENPNIKFDFSMNETGKGHSPIGIDKVKEVLYTLIANKELVSLKLYEHITQKSKSGEIVQGVYESFLGGFEPGQQGPVDGNRADVTAATGQPRQPSELPPGSSEVNAGDKVTDDDGTTYTVNATLPEAKAIGVFQQMLDTIDPSMKKNALFIEQLNEQIANPNRYNKISEDENPKGVVIGDKVRITKEAFRDHNGNLLAGQSESKPYEAWVVSVLNRNGKIEVRTVSNKFYGGWSDLSEVERINGGLDFDFGDHVFEKEGVKPEDRKPIAEENKYVKRQLEERPADIWEDRYKINENGVVLNPDIGYAYKDKIVEIRVDTAESKDGMFAAELHINVGTGGHGGPLSQYNDLFPTKKQAIDSCLEEAEKYLVDSLGPKGSQVTENQKANVRKALGIVKTRKIQLDKKMVADELDFRERYDSQIKSMKEEKKSKMGVVETPEADNQIIDLGKTTKEVAADEPSPKAKKQKPQKKAEAEPVAEKPAEEPAQEPPTPPTEPPSSGVGTAPEAPLPQAETVVRPSRIDLSKADRFRVVFQDRMLPVKRLQEKAGDVPEDSDIYLAEELYKGRVQDALEKFRVDQEDRIRAAIDNIFKGSDHADRLKALTQDYLVALHAPERNKAHYDGAAGVSTQEANDWRSLIESNPEFPKIKEASNLIKGLANSLPSFLLKNELIDQETFDKLSSVYVDYVPLNRIMDDETDFVNVIGIGKGFDIRGKEVKRAFGSKLAVDDIFHNVVANWEMAIVRAYKNKVGQTILRFAQRYPELGIFEIVPGKMASMVKEGEAFFYREAPKSPTVLSVKVEGKQKYIDIKDKDVATALKNLDAQSSSLLVNLLTPFTRLYSMMNTSLNPEFLLSNFARDLQQSTLNNVADFGLGSAIKGTSKIFSAQRGMIDFYRGKETEWSSLFKEMKAEGGTTAFFNVRSAEEITKLLRDGEVAFSESAAGFPVRVGKKMLDMISMLNDIVENGTRLATYKLAKDRGLSNARAASVAKNITVNFNRHGTAGPLMNALYAFSNASMQGTFRTFRTMSNPRTAIKLIATIAALTILSNLWNDENSPEEYEKIPMYEREGNWIIMYGQKEYVKIPIPWGFNVFKVATEYAYELSKGKKSAKAGVQATALALINAYNPLGSSSVLQSMIPTITRPLFDVKANTSWSGQPIAPMNIAKIKESLNYYDSTNEIFKEAANLMSKASGGRGAKPGMVEISPESLEYIWNQYTGGVGRMISKSYATLSNLGKGEPTPTKDIPFARRLMGETNEESFNKNQMFDILVRASQDVVPDDRPKLLNVLKSEIAAGRMDKEDAISKMRQFDNDQTKLKNVDAEVAYIKKQGFTGEKLDRFLSALQDKDFMKSKGKKPLNKTQIKVLKSLL